MNSAMNTQGRINDLSDSDGLTQWQRHPLRGLSLALLAFSTPAYVGPAWANPSGATLVHGSAHIDSSTPGVLTISNSPNAIIHWQDFSIAPHELTRFVQQNGQSSVLNRVTDQNPSELLGQLQSNGRVFVINPNGILVGAGARIDTQGLVASTLNLSDQDFLTGNYRFSAGEVAGAIRNQGVIRAGRDGNLILIAPTIENSGVLSTENGQILLAAGQSITLTSLDDPALRYEISAPGNEVLNLGSILTRGGAVDVFAHSITQAGTVAANGVEQDAQGRIHLVARETVTLTPASELSVTHQQWGAGEIRVDSQNGTTWASGTVSAAATAGKGGTVELLGEQVALQGAQVTASGAIAGGTVRIGGDLRGKNAAVHNAKAVFVDAQTGIEASATGAGDGGEVIVWSDKSTRMLGAISARGKGEGSRGGFIETSGGYLELGDSIPDASAPGGRPGTWLIDPEDVEITTVDNNMLESPVTGQIFYFPDQPNQTTTLNVSKIVSALNAGTDVYVTTLDVGNVGTEAGNITVNAAITKTVDPGTTPLLFLEAHNHIFVNQPISSTAGGLNLSLVADYDNSGSGETTIGASISTNGGIINTQNGNGGGSGIVKFAGSPTINGKLNAVRVVQNAGTVTLNDTLATTLLEMNGGTLTGSGDINVISAVQWTAGTLAGSGTLTTSSDATSVLSADTVTLAGDRVWNNEGVINWTGNGGAFDSFLLNGNSVFNNQTSGTFNDQTVVTNYAQIGSATSARFNNLGVIDKQGASVTRTAGTPFNNIGSLVINNGKIELGSDGVDTGAYLLSLGTLTLTGGNRTFNNVLISGSNYLRQSGGTLTLPAGSSLSFNKFELSGGSILGDGTLLVASGAQFDWLGGSVGGAGVSTVQTGGILNLNGDNLQLNDSRVWNNSGTVNWNGDGGGFDTLALNNTVAFNNQSGGIFNDNTLTTTYAQLGAASGAVFNNNGSFNKTGASVTRLQSTPFNHLGTAAATLTAGTLEWRTNGTDSGLYRLNGGQLTLNSGTRLWSGTLNGSSAFNVTGGTLDIQSGTTLSTLLANVSGGTVTGLGNWTVRSGDLFNWSGGSIGGSGVASIQSGGVLNLNGDNLQLNDSRVWNNSGTVNWNGDGGGFDTLALNNTVIFNNQSGGVFNDKTLTTTYAQLGAGVNALFTNAGIWNKTQLSTTRLIGTGWTNTGNVNVLSGSVEMSAALNDTAGRFNLNGGTFANTGGSWLLTDTQFSGASPLRLNAGTTSIPVASNLSANHIDIAGGSLVNNGVLTLKTGGTFTFNAGTMIGNSVYQMEAGTVTSVNADAFVLTGSSVWNNLGVFDWHGNGGAADSLQLAGTAAFNNLPGAVFNDRTQVGSAASLGLFPGAVFNNQGTFNKVGTSQTRWLDMSMLNTGSMNFTAGTVTGTALFNHMSGTLTLSPGVTLAYPNFQMMGGTVTGAGTWSVPTGSMFHWFGGTFEGTGMLENQIGATTLITGDAVGLGAGRIWENFGVVTWQGDGGSSDTLSLTGGSVLINKPDALFDDLTVVSGRAQIGGDSASVFRNEGVYRKSGASVSEIAGIQFQPQAGIIDIAAGATLDIRTSVAFTDPSAITGAGNIIFSGDAVFALDAPNVITGPVTDTLENGPLVLASVIEQPAHGKVVINGDGSITFTPEVGYVGPDTFVLDIQDSVGNSARGTVRLEINSAVTFNWNGGSTGNWNDPANWGGAVPVAGSDVVIGGSPGSVTIVFDASAGSMFLRTLQSNANINLTGGALTLGSGLGDISAFAPGTTFNLAGRAFGGNGTVNVQGAFNWDAGVMIGTGLIDLSNATSTTLGGGATGVVLNGPQLKFNTLNLSAPLLTMTSGKILASTVNIGPGSVLSMVNGALDTGTLDVSGALAWSAGNVTLDTAVIRAGGTLSILGGGQWNVATSTGSITNQGAIAKAGPNAADSTRFNTPLFVNAGNIRVASGLLDLGTRFTQSAGELQLSGGNVQAGSFDFNGGSLTGSGTFSGNVNNNGLNLNPGNSPGTLVINGDYRQGASASLTMEIEAATAGKHDQLVINGTAFLDGILNLVALPPYSDTAGGELIPFINANSISGNFSQITAPQGFSFSASPTAQTYQGVLSRQLTSAPVKITTPQSNTLSEQKVHQKQETQVLVLGQQFTPLTTSAEDEPKTKKRPADTTQSKTDSLAIVSPTNAEMCQ